MNDKMSYWEQARVAQIAQQALKELDERGWHQGGLVDPYSGRICAAGALRYAMEKLQLTGHVAIYEIVTHKIRELFPDRPHIISTFNDMPQTTEEDVRLLLKHVAEE